MIKTVTIKASGGDLAIDNSANKIMGVIVELEDGTQVVLSGGIAGANFVVTTQKPMAVMPITPNQFAVKVA